MFGFNLKLYKQFLTKNERNGVYLRKNLAEGRGIADSKYRTKRILGKAGVGVPKLLARFKTRQKLMNFDWSKLEGNFVVKPVSGYGGEGILIVRKQLKNFQFPINNFQSNAKKQFPISNFQLMSGQIINNEELTAHCQEILGGKFSMHGTADAVLVEERIKIHPMFLNLTKSGTPDVRVIVYNKVPVMAMFRIPTVASGGKANLQQGAYGLGIDLATGITTFGIVGKSVEMKKIYDFGKKKEIKVNGIKIPFWREILETAVKCQEAIPGLGFLGVDVVLDKDKGPMVLEVNARPGLSIQICNKAGLRRRMEKVEDINIKSVDQAISVSRYLFGENFSEKVKDKHQTKTIAPLEEILVKIPKGFKPELTKSPVQRLGKHRVVEVRAKVDTGAFRSSIDRVLAEKLGLLTTGRVLYYRHYKSSLGKHKDRPVVGVTLWLQGKKVMTAVNVADRNKLRTKFLLGRKDLEGFLISAKTPLSAGGGHLPLKKGEVQKNYKK